jgi:hypothetical protein
MSIEQAFTWTDDGLPGWRVIDRGESAIVFPDGDRAVGPAEAIQLARHHGQETATILTRTAAELQAALSDVPDAAEQLGEARIRLASGEGPSDKVAELVHSAVEQVDDETLKRGVEMLADAVRAAGGS